MGKTRMFDRNNQPTWLKLLNACALVIIAVIVFLSPEQRTMPVIAIGLTLFAAIASINFVIQFRDLLAHRKSTNDHRSDDESDGGEEDDPNDQEDLPSSKRAVSSLADTQGRE